METNKRTKNLGPDYSETRTLLLFFVSCVYCTDRSIAQPLTTRRITTAQGLTSWDDRRLMRYARRELRSTLQASFLCRHVRCADRDVTRVTWESGGHHIVVLLPANWRKPKARVSQACHQPMCLSTAQGRGMHALHALVSV